MKFLFVLVLGVILLFCMAWLLQILWPMVMVPIFGLPVINFTQSLALLVICNMLFRGHSTSNDKD